MPRGGARRLLALGGVFLRAHWSGLQKPLALGRYCALAGVLASGMPLATAADVDDPPKGQAPQRVVSVNLCTDQLAMLLAAPGQLLSVSHLARDPRSSVMFQEAQSYRINRGSAEDIYLMRPDLVLAGTYTTRFTTDLLRRLGIPVLELAPAARLSDVPLQIRQIGEALGRGAEAERIISQFEQDLAELTARPQREVRAAHYGPNGYTSGQGTLTDDLFEVAGLVNVAKELGLAGGGMLPLESLVMAAPELLVTSAPNKGPARAEEVLRHPALAPLRGTAGQALMSDADWVCGLPYILGALRGLVVARDQRLGFDLEQDVETGAGADTKTVVRSEVGPDEEMSAAPDTLSGVRAGAGVGLDRATGSVPDVGSEESPPQGGVE